MKKLLLLLLLIPALSFSQVQDSTTVKIINQLNAQAEAINRMSLYLDYCDGRYRTGTTMAMSGVGITGAGLLINSLGNGEGNSNSNAPIIVSGLGGLLTLIGGILIVDSHKWIGRAGRVKVDSNAITYKF